MVKAWEAKSAAISYNLCKVNVAKEVGTGRNVIIENQLEDTNHDHLGKLITYASGKSADVIIWLVKHAREEHKAAIEWLNNNTSENIGFFLCEIKLYKIDDSKPAVKFDVLEKPNDWSKHQRSSDDITETQQVRYDYWEQFNEYAFQNPKFKKEFNRRKPSYDHWMNYFIGSSSAHIDVQILQKRSSIVTELYIPEDKGLYKSLEENKDEIEAAAGMQFDWYELPDKKASKVNIEKTVDLDDHNKWQEQFDWMIDTMMKMKKAFRKYLV